MRRVRNRIFFFADVLVLPVAAVLAYLIRFEGTNWPADSSVVLTRLAHRTSASTADGERMGALAQPGVTMAVFLSAARPEALQDELLGMGSAYGSDTPAVIAQRVSWPDERLVRTTVGQLAEELRQLGATTTVLVLVGEALRQAAPPVRSHVYLPSFNTSFRSSSAVG